MTYTTEETIECTWDEFSKIKDLLGKIGVQVRTTYSCLSDDIIRFQVKNTYKMWTAMSPNSDGNFIQKQAENEMKNGPWTRF